jgi:hypothetical protein
MSEDVVVTTWDSATRTLEYVEINGGFGSARTRRIVSEQSAVEVGEVCEASLLPRVGELLVDGDVCVLALAGPQAIECSVRPRGDHTVRLTDIARNGRRVDDVTPEDLKVNDPTVLSRVDRIGRFLYFGRGARPDGVVGCWVVEGGLAGWLNRDREMRGQQEVQREQRAERRRRDGSFVNPYTFVPFPATIARRQPGGHHLLGPTRLSGVLTVRWRFTSPFQVPEGTVEGEPLRLHGASVKGAVRSAHETLAGGCLRVLDEEFVPSYRDIASELSPQWTLAEVATVTRDDQPLTVRVCDAVVWVRSTQLAAACGNNLVTGSRVTLNGGGEPSSLGRLELSHDATVTAGGDWVVLLTDGGARRPEVRDRKTGEKRDGAYFAACGHLPAGSAEIPVTEEAWRDFRRAVAGSRDVQERAAARKAGQRFDERPLTGLRKKPPVGRRKAATGRFARGDLVWVHRAGDDADVDVLKLSVIWRHAGRGPMRERVPKDLLACWNPERLCPSCRLFGAADTRPRQPEDETRQRSYAGHVRFGDAVTAEAVTLQTIWRAPLGAPRAGAGQFYLRHDSLAPAAHESDPPTREWGARPDDTGWRQVRGRKFYWHADPTAQPIPRHKAREHQRKNPKLTTERLLAPAGTVLSQTVTFDNLSHDELGSLLATLEPHRVLPAGDAGSRPLSLRLGGGKPLGLGSCTATVENLQVWTAQSRYGDTEAVTADPDDYVAQFVESTPPEVREVWPAVTAVLAADSVDAERVWYPPGRHWSEQREAQKDFDEPFTFFTGTSGMFLAERRARPLRPLPEPTEDDQYLPIIRDTDLDKGGA